MRWMTAILWTCRATAMKTQHQIISDGQINAQAEIEWEKVEEKGWTYGK